MDNQSTVRTVRALTYGILGAVVYGAVGYLAAALLAGQLGPESGRLFGIPVPMLIVVAMAAIGAGIMSRRGWNSG